MNSHRSWIKIKYINLTNLTDMIDVSDKPQECVRYSQNILWKCYNLNCLLCYSQTVKSSVTI
jgi:hypothetical protein